uniref:Uncharacterized protein n=1 Tax=Arundo donax TaxID=35708 RepID=A0A0A9HCH4_ARUDO
MRLTTTTTTRRRGVTTCRRRRGQLGKSIMTWTLAGSLDMQRQPLCFQLLII